MSGVCELLSRVGGLDEGLERCIRIEDGCGGEKCIVFETGPGLKKVEVKVPRLVIGDLKNGRRR